MFVINFWLYSASTNFRVSIYSADIFYQYLNFFQVHQTPLTKKTFPLSNAIYRLKILSSLTWSSNWLVFLLIVLLIIFLSIVSGKCWMLIRKCTHARVENKNSAHSKRFSENLATITHCTIYEKLLLMPCIKSFRGTDATSVEENVNWKLKKEKINVL